MTPHTPMPKVKHTLESAKETVKAAIGKNIWKELERHIAGADIGWVGKRKPDDLAKSMLLATAMHDLAGIAYGPITRLLHTKLGCSDRTIQTNVRRCRHALSQWGQDTIWMPRRHLLNQAASDINIPEWMGDVRLWADSADIPTAYLHAVRRPSGEWWSGKEQCPARRYMVFSDGDSVVRQAWGGYSPKVYDAHFLRIVKPWIEEKCQGMSIIGDTHFFSAAEFITDPRIVAMPPPQATIELLHRRNFAQNTAEVETRCRQVAEVRANVEQVFASIEKMSEFLAAGPYCKWQDRPEELDHVFYFCVGVHNRNIMNRLRRA